MREQYDDLAVVCYINSTAALKCKSDVCVTSSNAVKIVKALPNKNIFFIPDRNLARYVAKQVPEKNIIINDGYCPIHASITKEQLLAVKEKHPNAKILTHNEIVQNTALTLLGAESNILNPDLIGTGTDPYFVFRDCSEDRLPVSTRRGKVLRNKDSLLGLSKIQYQVNKEEVITGYLIASTNGLLKVKESDIFEYYMNYRYNHGETPYLNISIDYGAKVIKSRNLDYPLPCFQEKRIKESTTEILKTN